VIEQASHKINGRSINYLSMHTPAPVFEHGRHRKEEKVKRRHEEGWAAVRLNKTLQKNHTGGKTEKDLQVLMHQ